MKHFKHFFTVAATVLLSVNSSLASDFVYEGVGYTVTSVPNLTCAVDGEASSSCPTDLVIPSQVQFNNRTLTVTSVKKLSSSSLSSISLPNSVTTIESFAFNCPSLVSIDLPNSITVLERCAFYELKSLVSIELPTSLNSIPEACFCSCSSLQSITIPNSVTAIGESAFISCSSLEYIELPESVEIIHTRTFMNCTALKEVKFGENLTRIEDDTFNNCSSLESLTFPGALKWVELNHKWVNIGLTEGNTFKNCINLKKLRINSGDYFLCFGTSIRGYGDYVFEKKSAGDWTNSLETIYMDREIAWPGIKELDSLKELIIGEHLQTAENVALNEATKLSTIISYAQIPSSGINCTHKQYMNIEVKVPKGTLEAYQNAYGWKNFWNISEMEDDLTGMEINQVNSTKHEIGRYNLQGHIVGDDYQGVVVIKYSDGSTRKVVNNY